MEELLAKRKANRLPCFDYSRTGYYFVTMCTWNRAHVLWGKNHCVGATCGRPPLSCAGRCVEAELARLSHIYPGVTLDKAVVMPNHVHLILRIDAEDGRPKAAPTVSRIMQQFKGAVAKRVGKSIWQKGFYDHIIRDEDDYLRIWAYMDQNPVRWREDCYYGESGDIL